MTGAPAALLLIHGEERFLVDRASRAWLASARAVSASDLNVETFDAPGKLDQLRRSLSEVPFLDDRRHVLVRDPPQLAERARRGGEPPEVLLKALQDRAPTTSVCLAVRGRVAATNAVLKAFRGLGGEVAEHPALRQRELREWPDRAASERGLRLPRAALDHVLRVANGDLGAMTGELDKLVSFAGDARTVSLDDVRRLAAGSEQVQVWDVLDRLLGPSPGRGAAALDTLIADGASSQYLTSVLAGQLREILLTHEAMRGRAGAGAVAAALGLPPWRAERLIRWASATSPEMVEGWLERLQRVDALAKMGKVDDTAGLRSTVLRAARQVGERRPRTVAATDR